ncbi:alanine racemase [Actinomyces faecalis]|uniref:alanine racemase n=1 Tax=Actinomyces faecalis TaxID=2722820 RepID=UPI001FD07E90|nr:alanine racemase [Actinomyces faecalis]
MTVASFADSPVSQASVRTWAADVRAPGAATACALIDLEALAHNARVLAGTAGRAWMAVVKADAYGHGIEAVARTCLDAGASWLGVAQLDEALHLRGLLDAAGVARPRSSAEPASSREPRLLCWLVPVLSPEQAAQEGSPLREALVADLDLSVSTLTQLQAVRAAARAQGVIARIHVKVDTGMSRAGAVPEDLPDLARAARASQDEGLVDVVGLWSHLSRADEPDSGSTEDHLERFRRGEQVLHQAGLRPRVRHLSATGGLQWHPEARLDLVRAGIGLYGFSPEPGVATSQELGLRPVMRLQAPLVQVKRIPAGQAVSYGGTWVAPTDRWVGLVPVGYGDGVPRAAASAGPVWVAGRRTTLVGRVCMDQVVVDLGPARDPQGHDLPAPAAAGDLAVLWGDPQRDGEGVPTAEEWARVCSTISYEIVTRLGPRVPRVAVGPSGRGWDGGR